MMKNKLINFSNVPIWDDSSQVLRSGRLGLLCNQTAWHPETGEYLFETFYKRSGQSNRLKKVFIPEHGLFGELQDQVKLEGNVLYRDLEFDDCEFVSLYGGDESSLNVKPEKINDLDALVVDLQDVGVRYYTFISTLRNLFITLAEKSINIPVYIIDRENPAGPQVEGSPLKSGYGSFIGIEGLPHRHGLTIGEIACYFHAELSADFQLNIISHKVGILAAKGAAADNAGNRIADNAFNRFFPWTVPPSPNIPGFFTCDFYSGQCLWEGTNVSEGRGTTRPFEVFGAPWMETLLAYNKKAGFKNWNDIGHPLFDPGAALRWHYFIPTFHKHKDECCFGFQLVRRDGPYHALLHAIKIIRFIKKQCSGFSFRPGKYEAGNDKTAIELLAGDPIILDCLYNEENMKITELENYFKQEETKWIDKTCEFRLYDEPLRSVSGQNI